MVRFSDDDEKLENWKPSSELDVTAAGWALYAGENTCGQAVSWVLEVLGEIFSSLTGAVTAVITVGTNGIVWDGTTISGIALSCPEMIKVE